MRGMFHACIFSVFRKLLCREGTELTVWSVLSEYCKNHGSISPGLSETLYDIGVQEYEVTGLTGG